MPVASAILRYPDSYAEVDGKKLAPGKHIVQKGKKVKFVIRAKNVGERGQMFIRLVNKETGFVIKKEVFNVGYGDIVTFEHEVTMDSPITVYAQSGRIRKTSLGYEVLESTDEYGDWRFVVSEAERTKIPWYIWILLLGVGALIVFRIKR